MSIQKRQTPDIRFSTIDGVELGLGEIKPFNATSEEVEEDRVRLAELSKKMLHRRILNAKTEKEFSVFAMIIFGYEIEYYAHNYNRTKKPKYKFVLLKKSTLPTLPSAFHNMSTSLETLLHFKERVEDSLPLSSELTQPYLYQEEYVNFKPTVTLLAIDDE